MDKKYTPFQWGLHVTWGVFFGFIQLAVAIGFAFILNDFFSWVGSFV